MSDEQRIKSLEEALLIAICALKSISFSGLHTPKVIADATLERIEPALFTRTYRRP